MNRQSLLRIFAGLAFVGVLTGSLFLIRTHGSGSPDFAETTSGQSVDIEIPEGATGSDIAKILVDAGVVKSNSAFFQVAVGNSDSSRIAPGSHRIDLHISALSALSQLLDSKRISNLIKVPEGAWTSEVIDLLVKSGFKKNELLDALQTMKLPTDFPSSEGIFFPAQYSFAKNTSAAQAIEVMVRRFESEAVQAGLTSATDGFSPLQLLTIASIIQAEGDAGDFSKISRVIRNRLTVGMQLQMDTTVHYVLKTRGQVFLSSQSTQVSSPYNTYRNYGLPPGPIGNPGRAAMNAALAPDTGDWLYFITVKPGDTRFTKSDSQFLTWKQEYEKNLRAGLFGNKK